ncbi:hypothetical protein BDY24DRAFT_380850 [Mrakia frigida]|uniref:Yip5p n=1 Tax=Mrakia frigida TaxID=29902 RepID=UPI003FCC1BAC
MSRQPGYTIVDVDEEEGGDMGRSEPQGLEFKTYLGTTPSNVQSEYDGGVNSSSSRGVAPPTSLFNLAYYQYLFDIDSVDVLQRCGKAMLPIPSQPTGNFIQDVCDGRPDLYGPFWTLTTLAFTLYVFSSLSTSISAYIANPDVPPIQDIGKISFAAALVYSYGIGFPALLWAVVRWLGGAEVGWGVVEALVIYGYAMSVYIPISVLCIIPIPMLRWILVGLGAGSSGWFLIRNIYPVLAGLDSKFPRLLVIAIVVLHAAIALTFKVVFFSYSVGGTLVGEEPLPGLGGEVTSP